MRTNTYFVQFQVAGIPELDDIVFTFAKTITQIPDDPDLAGKQIMELIYAECSNTIKIKFGTTSGLPIGVDHIMFMTFSLIDSFPNKILTL